MFYQRFVAAFGLVDVRCSSSYGYTYPAHPLPSRRLDLFLVSPTLAPYCSLSVNPPMVDETLCGLVQRNFVQFDHLAVLLQLHLENFVAAAANGAPASLFPLPVSHGPAGGTRSRTQRLVRVSAPQAASVFVTPQLPSGPQVSGSHGRRRVFWPSHINIHCSLQKKFAATVTSALRCIVSEIDSLDSDSLACGSVMRSALLLIFSLTRVLVCSGASALCAPLCVDTQQSAAPLRLMQVTRPHWC